ncbi:MAG: demethylmenaquinone methyltransferase / 2-methoxy-6-polyprenyl,4-benzoquinol methylase, partial [Solirubrobacteraceae bacterium]|nr:demethylmenaquinone methyltransferase / 2-methoxy-6-polyprenyl,4-benzoquinol methylase [Solirubrobacteraceae bacterium]
PLIGRLTGESVAYSYLPSSVKRFPSPEGLAESRGRAGRRDIRWVLTAGGIIAIHAGTKG